MASPETKIIVTASEIKPEETYTPKDIISETLKDGHETNPNSNGQTSCNPNLPEGEETDILERLRGDAIGDTLYSERFVISTLLKLGEMKESLESDEKFERDLESLWDMTIEEDVVSKLIDLNVYDVFTQSIVKYEEDYRLIEILVGIIGNMSAVSEKAIELLCKTNTAIEVLLQLIACSDSCVLIQLMRLITTIYGNIETAKIWNHKIVAYKEFVEHFCFILSNSNNQLLLIHSLEALNAILAKTSTIGYNLGNDAINDNLENSSSFLKKLAESDLSTASSEAFQTFYTKETNEYCNNEADDFLDADVITESLKKSFTIFLNIHDIFLNHAEKVYDEDSIKVLSSCLSIILNDVSKPNFVKPSNIDYLGDMLECLWSIYTGLPSLHGDESTLRIINIWWVLKQHIHHTSNGHKEALSDFEADDVNSHESFQNPYNVSKELLNTVLKNYSESELISIFKVCKTEHALEVFKLYGVEIDEYHEEEISVYCHQLKIFLSCQRQ